MTLLISQGVVCLPLNSSLALPPDVTHIAHDQDSNQYLAFLSNGSLYQKYSEYELTSFTELYQRGGSQCPQVSYDELKRLPGWPKIDQYFKDQYSGGKDTKANIVTNPSDFPSQGAVVCPSVAVTTVQAEGKPKCISQKVKLEGHLKDATGIARISVTQGYTNTATWMVQKSSELATAAEITVTFKIPGIIDVGGDVTTTTTFTNTNTNAFTTSFSDTNKQELALILQANKHCFGQITSTSCNLGGVAHVKLVASGWVWYNFPSKVAPKGGKDKHYKWAHKIEDLLHDINDRSSVVDVTGSMTGTSQSHYKAVCN